MKKPVIIIAILMAIKVLNGQDIGVVGNKITRTVTVTFYSQMGTDGRLQPKYPFRPGQFIPSNLNTNDTNVYSQTVTLATSDLPVPYHAPLNSNTYITKAQAIAYGADLALVTNLEAAVTKVYSTVHPDTIIETGEIPIQYNVTTSGSYVGQWRNTFETLTQGTTDLNDWDYSRYVKERLELMGRHCVGTPAYVTSNDFVGNYCTVNNLGSDLVFYSGHGWSNGSGPAVTGTEAYPDYVRNFTWGRIIGSNRGARWMLAQSCNWFIKEYTDVTTQNIPATVNATNSRWSNAFANGQGSLHGIFGYASEAWDIGHSTVANYPNFSATNLAPVSALETLRNGASMGPAWFWGAYSQTAYQYGGGPGTAPACITVYNWYGDYFNEQGMWPDPADLNDSNTKLVFHYQIYNSAMNGNGPWW